MCRNMYKMDTYVNLKSYTYGVMGVYNGGDEGN